MSRFLVAVGSFKIFRGGLLPTALCRLLKADDDKMIAVYRYIKLFIFCDSFVLVITSDVPDR